MTSMTQVEALNDVVDEVIDEACASAEMAVINAEGALLATSALGRRAFTENSPVLSTQSFRLPISDAE